MPNTKWLISELANHAMAKNGVLQASSWCQFDVSEYPHLKLPGAAWTEFFEVDRNGDEQFARIPVFANRLKEHQKRYPRIREMDWIERDSHVFMAVPLDAGLPIEFLQIGSDGNSGMAWSDGGELTFCADAKALAEGRIERIWATCQGA